MCVPGDSDGKESVCNSGEMGSIPRLGRSPREGNGNLLQYSCLENPMDRGAWQATVHRCHIWLDMTEATLAHKNFYLSLYQFTLAHL